MTGCEPKARGIFCAALLFCAGAAGARADWTLVQKVVEAGNPNPPCTVTIRVKMAEGAATETATATDTAAGAATGTAGEIATNTAENNGASEPRVAKIRVDIPPEISLILDAETGETLTLRHSQKTVLRMDARGAEALLERFRREQAAEALAREFCGETALAAAPGVAGLPGSAPTFTGKREKIGKIETEVFALAAGPMRMTWWVARAFPGSDGCRAVMAALRGCAGVRLASQMLELPAGFDFPGVPIKTEMTMPDGRVVVTLMESIRGGCLPGVDFLPPPDYRGLPTPDFSALK